MKIKIFYTQTEVENSFDEIEKKVNDWIAKQANKITVIAIHLSSFPTAFAVTVQYAPRSD